ncbi:hypothetical protein EEB11_03020 [Pseudotabrizicola sediminis]|uniref:Uncharacterized protein n=1 Tax=Pseudotabrizicola sediminis TaxID=2486418 RepID=A0ABY2KTL3_9RHOB|nr:hypothetical protein [Pseudotabrizicola sediminis]TGD44575.1 hypothetical protein EEB11_03020 [Pseudotabrizicola sediminis]
MAHEPGWDSKAIARIAKEKYGGTQQMFEAHDWPERGSKMMTSQQRHVTERYGSVLAFVEHHEGKE